MSERASKCENESNKNAKIQNENEQYDKNTHTQNEKNVISLLSSAKFFSNDMLKWQTYTLSCKQKIKKPKKLRSRAHDITYTLWSMCAERMGACAVCAMCVWARITLKNESDNHTTLNNRYGLLIRISHRNWMTEATRINTAQFIEVSMAVQCDQVNAD